MSRVDGLWVGDWVTDTVNAINNWWGDPSGPSGDGPGSGDTVVGNTEYDPWIKSLTYTEGPQPASAVILEATLIDSDDAGIPSVQIDFYVEGELVGSASTDPSGIASYTTSMLAGIYSAYAKVACLNSEIVIVPVYDPSAGFVTGGGWIDSPTNGERQYMYLGGKATFGFVSKYNKRTELVEGNTEFQFNAGGLNFHSSEYEWLVVNQGGTNAQFKGAGTINGEGEYKFMLWAGDGDPDTFRIKIWYEDDGAEVVVYDNGTNQQIGAGNIVVHKQ